MLISKRRFAGGGIIRLRIDLPQYGAGNACSTAGSDARRSAGTSPVVACTRAFATSCSQRKAAALAACLSGLSPSWRMVATNGTQKLPLNRSGFAGGWLI